MTEISDTAGVSAPDPISHARHREPRRTLNSLALALLAVVLGWLAQGEFLADRLVPGLLLYAVAIPLFAAQFVRHASPFSAHTFDSLVAPTSQASRRPGPMWVGMAAAGVVSLVALGAFLSQDNGAAWLLYLSSVGLAGVAMWSAALARWKTSPPQDVGRKTSLAAPVDWWLLGILAMGLALRLFRIPSVPFGTWYDEAVAGIDARQILLDPGFRPVFWQSMNHPAHHLYLFALGMRLLGDNIQAMRAVSVAFGMGTIVTAFLFGREVGGKRWGLLLAFLVATLRWDINFSRIAMNSIDVPFFVFLTLYFFHRVARSRFTALVDCAGAGLSLGLGLCFYTGFRLFVLALAFYGAWRLCWWFFDHRAPSPRGEGTQVSAAVSGLGILILATWIAVMPVLQYAIFHRDTFWQRTQTVSIFTNRDEPDLFKALANNTQKHLLMFNYRGDNNGRHNLPGVPTLDRLSAILFALGIGVACTRRGPVNTFFLVLLPFGLAGGIFSLDFEAPQSLRSIAALPAVVFFIGLSLNCLWDEWKWAARVEVPRLSLVPALAILAAIGAGNAVTFFGRQAADVGVWQAFSATETLVAKDVAAQGPEPVFYFSQLFYDHPCIRFHAPSQDTAVDRVVLSLPDPLPIRRSADRPVVIYIHPDEAWVVDAARRLYADAQFDALPHEPGYPLAVHVVRLSADDVASVQGLSVMYRQDDEEGPAQAVETVPAVDTVWPATAPLPLPFTAEWNGILHVPAFGRYGLQVEAPGDVQIALDGERVLGSGVLSSTRLLAQGNHSLHLTAQGGDGPVRLQWRPPDQSLDSIAPWSLYHYPVTANGLLGKYYANADWSGEPVMERNDPRLDVYFHLTPLPRPYSVEWTGVLQAPSSGAFQFGLRAVDEASLFLDGNLVVETKTPDEYVQGTVTLEAGYHDLRVLFQDLTNRSRIHLYWVPPAGEKGIIPSEYLWPSQDVADTSPAPVVPANEEILNVPVSLGWMATWGKEGSGSGEFREPRDIAVTQDKVYVADTGNRRVVVLDRNGTPVGEINGDEAPFEEPVALGVDPMGNLLVLDSLPGWIYRFNDQGKALPRIAGPTTLTFHPRGMTVLEDGTIFIADTGSSRILYLDADGDVAGGIGRLGDSPGTLNEPTDVLVDSAGILYVVEAFNARIQRMDRWGGSLNTWSIPPSVAYDGPHAVWAPDGTLLVTAPGEGAIQRFAIDGTLLNNWTHAGPTPMRRPVGIFLDDRGVLRVTDTLSHQVYVFKLDVDR